MYRVCASPWLARRSICGGRPKSVVRIYDCQRQYGIASEGASTTHPLTGVHSPSVGPSVRGLWVRALARIAVLSSICGALALAALLLAVRVWWQAAPGDNQRSRGLNALWAAHTWVGDAHTDAEYAEFASRLKRDQISDVFFHAGPLESDGSVPGDRIAHASELLAAMKRYAPEVHAQAYLGQVLRRDGGPLDLTDEGVRTNIVETASRFLAMGFDGIHYDIEPIDPGDDAFLDLLSRTHEVTQAHRSQLSVAIEPLEPLPGAQRVLGLFAGRYHGPSREYLRDVAARVDQVAIMTYDTGLPAAWLFGAYTAWETEGIVDAIGDRVTVFMGVPTYDEGNAPTFHSNAENITSGIRGVRKGLDRLDKERTRHVGIAIYADWTTSEDEWRSYEAAWLDH